MKTLKILRETVASLHEVEEGGNERDKIVAAVCIDGLKTLMLGIEEHKELEILEGLQAHAHALEIIAEKEDAEINDRAQVDNALSLYEQGRSAI